MSGKRGDPRQTCHKQWKWTAEQDEMIKARYPNELNSVLCKEIGCSVSQLVYRATKKLGVKKSDEFVSEIGRQKRVLGWELARDEPQVKFLRAEWPEWLLPSPPSGLEPRVTHICRGDELTSAEG